jgi:kynurenine formamidase
MPSYGSGGDVAPSPDPDDVLAALALARSGRVYDLGTELSSRMPQGDPDTFAPFRLRPFRIPAAVTTDQAPPFDFSMEEVSGSLHVGTHLDGLAHIHADGVMHGGIRSRDAWSDDGWRANGAETVAPIVRRGILLDAARHRGVDVLPDDVQLGVDDVAGMLHAAQLEVAPGTAVLIRTGKMRQFLAGSEDYSRAAPGVGPDAAVWLAERGMGLLGTDTSGTEAHPMPDRHRTTHRALLVERGIHLLEILDLEQLGDHGVREFCLVALPLKIVGATGSWVRPIAIV